MQLNKTDRKASCKTMPQPIIKLFELLLEWDMRARKKASNESKAEEINHDAS